MLVFKLGTLETDPYAAPGAAGTANNYDSSATAGKPYGPMALAQRRLELDMLEPNGNVHKNINGKCEF